MVLVDEPPSMPPLWEEYGTPESEGDEKEATGLMLFPLSFAITCEEQLTG